VSFVVLFGLGAIDFGGLDLDEDLEDLDGDEDLDEDLGLEESGMVNR
jgi:hypothetical protein